MQPQILRRQTVVQDEGAHPGTRVKGVLEDDGSTDDRGRGEGGGLAQRQPMADQKVIPRTTGRQ